LAQSFTAHMFGLADGNQHVRIRENTLEFSSTLLSGLFLYLAFNALTLLVGRHEGHPGCKKLSGGVLARLSVWSKVQTCIWPSWCHCHSPSLASLKSRLVLPFWYRLTQVVLEKGPLNGCVCVFLYLSGKNGGIFSSMFWYQHDCVPLKLRVVTVYIKVLSCCMTPNMFMHYCGSVSVLLT